MTHENPAEPGTTAEPAAPPSTDNATAPTGRAARAGRRRRRRKQPFWRELITLVVIALVLAGLIQAFLVKTFYIPSGSMEQTLHGCPGCSGDRVLVNRLVYRFRDPRPGDIVVFRGPESWAPEVQVAGPTNILQRGVQALGELIGVAQPSEKDFIKRVIAVGGQTVQCCDAQGRVTVNGKPLTEPYIYTDAPEDPQLSTFGPVTVPADHMWLMGDHRNASLDSRAHVTDADHGTVSIKNVIGKAFVIVWPPSRWNTLGNPMTVGALGPLGAPAPLVLSFAMVLPFGMWRRSRRVAAGRTGRSGQTGRAMP